MRIRARGRHATPEPVDEARPPGHHPPTAPRHRARTDSVGHLVRPYVRTGGRTRARTVLELETMVSLPEPCEAPIEPEHREINRLCATRPRSVAELATFTALPLGVTRVLLDDMAELGLVLVDALTGETSAGRGPDLSVMGRVLEGLRRL